MNFISSILSVFIFIFAAGCKKASQKPAISPELETSLIDTIDLGKTKLLVEYGENQIPKNIFPLNVDFLKGGYAFGYTQNGELERLSQWIEGTLEGEMNLLEQGLLKSKQIFLSGHLAYKEDYLEGVKVENQLYPTILEGFLFEDKYYAKIKFPINYKGNLKMMVKDYQAVVRPLDHQTFQLVINDALDLSSYTLILSYHPAEQDSLVRSDYLYTQVVFAD